MEWIQQVSYPLDDRRRGELVYAGKLLVFKRIAAMGKFCSFADSLIKEAFGSADPEKAQFQLGRDEYLAKASTLQNRFKQHPETKQQNQSDRSRLRLSTR